MTHYAHRHFDPKTRRFIKRPDSPHKPSSGPHTPTSEPPETPAARRERLLAEIEHLSDAELEARDHREYIRAAADADARQRNAARPGPTKRPAPDWHPDPRRLGEPGGDGDGGLGAF